MEIKILEDIKREDAYKLWYDVYFKEMKRDISGYDHINQKICDDLEPNSIIFSIYCDNQIVATSRINMINDLKKSNYSEMLSELNMENGVFLTKTIVKRENRGNNFFKLILSKIEDYLIDKDKNFIVLDCNDYMVDFFKKLNFELIESNTIQSPHYGNVYLMKKDL